MKRLLPLGGVILILLIGAAVLLTGAPSLVTLRGEPSVMAGQVWRMTITIEGAPAGTKATVTLFSGFSRTDDTVTLGTGGLAEWQSPPLTQAGSTLVIVSSRWGEAQMSITVVPEAVKTLDLFATANSLLAYGGAQATLMILPRDAWGNAPLDAAGADAFQALIRYPDNSEMPLTFHYHQGLGWGLLRTQGTPGRVRIDMTHGPTASLELQQVAAEPAAIQLSVSPPCALNDGRDLILLTAAVTDHQGAAVADGTLITFAWQGGFGYGRTTQGQAVLRLPVPQEAGQHRYTASVDGVTSSPVWLRVETEICPDEP